jgi:hypothetical protein
MNINVIESAISKYTEELNYANESRKRNLDELTKHEIYVNLELKNLAHWKALLESCGCEICTGDFSPMRTPIISRKGLENVA